MIAFLLRLRRDDTVIIGDGSIGQEEDDMVQRVSNDARRLNSILYLTTVVGVSQREGKFTELMAGPINFSWFFRTLT